jgi:hypothetical protein
VNIDKRAALFITAVLAAGGIAHAVEDDPGWNCVTDGNRICGPGNANGVPPGCYDTAGVLVAPWPCQWHEGTGALPGSPPGVSPGCTSRWSTTARSGSARLRATPATRPPSMWVVSDGRD